MTVERRIEFSDRVVVPIENYEVLHPKYIKLVRELYLPPFIAYIWGKTGEKKKVLTDSRRACIDPERVITIGETTFYVSKKGVGGCNYLPNPQNLPSPLKERVEKWLKDNGDYDYTIYAVRNMVPFGAQWLSCSKHGLNFSKNLDSSFSAFNANFCPVIGYCSFPNKLTSILETMTEGAERIKKPYLSQETRLVPSNVRPIHLSDENVLTYVTKQTKDKDEFLSNLFRSAISLCVFPSTTCKPTITKRYKASWFKEYIYGDSVIAPNGIVYFIDLESIVWPPRSITKERLIIEVLYRQLSSILPYLIRLVKRFGKDLGDILRDSLTSLPNVEFVNGKFIITLPDDEIECSLKEIL